MLARPSISSSINIRPLNAADANAYRKLRKNIYETKDAKYFSDSYERERQLSEADWFDWCTEKLEHCILGTFDRDELVGIIMITRQGGADSPIVEWEAAWLHPRYRGTGIGKLSYDHARKWSVKHGYKFVAGFIRATYTPATFICKDLGFEYAYTVKDELWADGTVDDVLAFLLDIRPDASTHSSHPITTRYREAWPYLAQGFHAPGSPQQVIGITA